METDFRANNGVHKQKKAVNKRILFPIDENSDFTSQNEGFIKKIRFHYAEKLLGFKWCQIVGERLPYKNGFSLI